MNRKSVTLVADIITELPEDFDPDTSEGQTILRERFISFLKAAQYLHLSFTIEDE